MSSSFFHFAVLAGASLGLAACVVVADDPPHRVIIDEPSGTVGSAAPAAATPPPMLVDVDTNQVMTATPGDGVGVFTEYAAGGKWHVWWTCDTNTTSQPCDFTVHITAGSGVISDVDASALAGGYLATPTTSELDARTRTTTEVHGVTFTTDPGAVITLEAQIGSIEDGSFLFFVQNGQVNGGFTGTLTDPLQLEGSTP